MQKAWISQDAKNNIYHGLVMEKNSPKCLSKQTLNTCGPKMRMVYPGGLAAEHKQFPQLAGPGHLRKVHSSDFLFQQALWSALEIERHALLGAD